MSLHPLAGMPVPASLVANVPGSSATISAWHWTPAHKSQLVALGTSGY